MSTFDDFPLSDALRQSIAEMGFVAPLPIQEKTIAAAMDGRDLVACSATGTGKTAAYLIPIIESLLDMEPAVRFRPMALVLAPTRELAVQVEAHFRDLARHTRLRGAVVIGGMDANAEERILSEGVDLLVATPGRLLDHMARGGLKFANLEHLVIDEADRLLDAGFLPELRRIIDELPDRRQTMLFSATMPDEMQGLARDVLYQPLRIQVGAVAEAKDTIDESFWPVPEKQKLELLLRIVAGMEGFEKVIVFVRTRGRARDLGDKLGKLTGLTAADLHGDLTQAERTATLDAFRNGEIRLLVATDVAARGLDIGGLTHVVNFDVPNTPDDYIHRIGRTGRVDRKGVAITLVAPSELLLSVGIEQTLRRRIPIRRVDGFPYDVPPPSEEPDFLMSTVARKKTAARKFRERLNKPSDGKRQSPFTKSGQLRAEFREDAPEDEDRARRNFRKRLEKRIMNKKLPHQRRRRG